MKKVALYIAIAFILLLMIIIIPADKDAGLGSDPRNITMGGHVAEDDEFIYYTASGATYGESGIYKATKDFSKMTKIPLSSNVNSLNVSGNYIYYTVGDPGFIFKMSKNGIFRWPVVLKNVSNVIVSGDRIYYIIRADWEDLQTGKTTDRRSRIYSCNLYGFNRKLILEEETTFFVVDGDFIYYTDSNDSLWRIDTSGENKENIDPGVCPIPEFDKKYIYFTSDGYACRADKETLEKEVLFEHNFACRNLHGDWIYFTEGRDGDIYRITKDGKNKELLLESDITSFRIAGNSIFFDLYGKGYFRLDIETREVTKLSDS